MIFQRKKKERAFLLQLGSESNTKAILCCVTLRFSLGPIRRAEFE